MAPADRGTWLFRGSAAGALCLHALLAFGPGELRGGADLLPHLWLIEAMTHAPAVRTVYAPAYHIVGSLVSPWLGLAFFPRVFAFAAAAALIAGFRSFQRAAKLPDVTAALFVWAPYSFALTWCVPKVEAAGYALAFYGLGRLLAKRSVALALAVAATFAVHTAAGLFLGLAGCVLALARREPRAFSALALGAALASPLFALHLAAGCRLAEAFLLSSGDYLRDASAAHSTLSGGWLAVLAGSPMLVAAVGGAPALWRRDRALALLCLLVVTLCTNEWWLAPFGTGTTLNLLRGLTLLAFAAAVGAGAAIAQRPRLAAPLLAISVVWALAAAVWAVPKACFVRPFNETEVAAIRVDRCAFRWHRAGPAARASQPAGAATAR